MKLAIASEGKHVSGHFGHCEGFTVYEVDGRQIVNRQFVENPGHKPGFLPVFLKDLDIDVIVSGGMGAKAQELFNENGIEVVVGAQGFCDDVVEQYIRGELESTGSVCREHAHEGHCEE